MVLTNFVTAHRAHLRVLSVFVPFWQRAVSKESTVSSAVCTKSPRGKEEEEEARASILPVGVSTVFLCTYQVQQLPSCRQRREKVGSE